ncbi:MAG TPA: addiction module protein [Alphaproteobacteria bacterium]
MAATIKSLGIDRLGVEERLNLLEELWDSIAETTGAVPLTEPQRAELERRYAEDDKRPDDVIPWEQVKASTLSRLAGR